MRLPHPWSGRKSQENLGRRARWRGSILPGHSCVLHQLDPAVRVTTYLPAGFGALGGCQWREVSSPALWSRQSFGGAGGAAGVSRCGASYCETIPLGSVVGQDGADSLAAYRQEDPTTKEVDDLNRNESLELKHQRVVVLNEDKTQIVGVESTFPSVGSPHVSSLPMMPCKGHSHP